MLNDQSFSAALRVFNKTRSSLVGCLRAAIEAFKLEEARQIDVGNPLGSLSFFIIDTQDGPSTGLLIAGFSDSSEIERFVMGKLHASGE